MAHMKEEIYMVIRVVQICIEKFFYLIYLISPPCLVMCG